MFCESIFKPQIDLTPYEDYFSTVELIRIPLTRRTGRRFVVSLRYERKAKETEEKRAERGRETGKR